ncbi:MAG: hypothetical protein ACK55I_45950, partial [bacterium]
MRRGQRERRHATHGDHLLGVLARLDHEIRGIQHAREEGHLAVGRRAPEVAIRRRSVGLDGPFREGQRLPVELVLRLALFRLGVSLQQPDPRGTPEHLEVTRGSRQGLIDQRSGRRHLTRREEGVHPQQRWGLGRQEGRGEKSEGQDESAHDGWRL